MNDTVIVLGAGGFIGQAMIKAMASRKIPVIAIARDARKIPRHPLVEPIAWATGKGDLRTLLQRSRAVLHLATTSTPGTSAAHPLNEIDTNLRLTASLLQALQMSPEVELLYMSSGGSLYTEACSEPATENSPARPRSYHGAAKLAAESFISAWSAQYGGRATILRPSNVYGPGQPERPGFGIIPTAFGKLIRGEELHIWGDGNARRDYIYIDELIRLCDAVLAKPMPDRVTIVNACSGKSTSLNVLLDTIESVSGRTLKRSYLPSRRVDASTIEMDPQLAQELYGWQHHTSLADGLARAWHSHLTAMAGIAK